MLLPQTLRSKRVVVPSVLLGALFAFVMWSFGDIALAPPSSEPLWAFLGESSVDAIFPYLDMARAKQNTLKRASWGALSQQGSKNDMRQNLRHDKQYFTAYNAAGWNNEVMTVFNTNTHLGGQAYDLLVSDVFDLVGLSEVIDTPVIELHELKTIGALDPQRASVVYDGEHPQNGADGKPLQIGAVIPPGSDGGDKLSCWSFWESRGHHGLRTTSMGSTSAQFTPLPLSMYFDNDPDRPNSLELGNWLARPHNSIIPEESLELLRQYPELPVPEDPPEDHLACVDMVYYFAEDPSRYDALSEATAGGGSWQHIGRYVKYQPGLVDLANRYLRRMFGLRDWQSVPPYMAIHIRRNDFPKEWLAMTPRQYAHAASELIGIIKRDTGVNIKNVVVTTDEKDPEWLAGLQSYGFHLVSHKEHETIQRLGAWFPTLIDSVILAGGKAFLGTDKSTMSILAMRRVIDWNDGVGRMIDLGHPVPEGWEWP